MASVPSAPPPRSFRTALVAGMLLLSPVAGCEGCDYEDGGDQAAGLPRRGVGPAGAAPATGGETQAAPEEPPGARFDPQDPRSRPTLAGKELSEEGHGARDLPGELSRAFGTPTPCFPSSYLETQPGALVVTLSARVKRDGEISSVRVSAPGAPDDVVTCLEERAGGLTLRAPVPAAPRRVETRVTFQLGTGRPGAATPAAEGAAGDGPAAAGSSEAFQRSLTAPLDARRR